MTSLRKRRANRANAKASTGPKTARGKARAAQNARRHGLSVSIFASPILSDEAEKLAREIAGEGAGSDVVDSARWVAAAQIDLARVGQARWELLSRDINNPDYQPLSYMEKNLTMIAKGCVARLRRDGPTSEAPPEVAQWFEYVIHYKPQGDEKLAWILSERMHKLALMDRYERRALSRRKFAIRAFDAVRSKSL